MPTSTPLPPQIEQFLHDNPQGVLTSIRRNGMPQLSIVTVYPRDGGVGISITETRAKFKNLLRDPRCSVLVSHVDWWSGFLVFEGRAELVHSGNADPETLRLARRHIFSATTREGSRLPGGKGGRLRRRTRRTWRISGGGSGSSGCRRTRPS
jgi:PPOX class probable F420-dependent enzyme